MFLMLWIVNWFADSVGPTGRVCRLPVDYRAPRRLHQGHHRHETHRLLPELHHVRPVPDCQVGRLRTLARISEPKRHHVETTSRTPGMAGRRARVRLGRDVEPAARMGMVERLSIAGLVCILLYVLSQWREIARRFSGRQARYGTLAGASVLIVLAILAAINYLAERHNKRWDLTAASQYHAVGSDQEGPAGADQTGQGDGLRAYRRLRAIPFAPRGIPVPAPSSCRSITSIRRNARRSPSRLKEKPSERSCSSTTGACSA